jgi:hypothetical protein
MVAAANGHLQIIFLLLDLVKDDGSPVIDVAAQDFDGLTALNWAENAEQEGKQMEEVIRTLKDAEELRAGTTKSTPAPAAGRCRCGYRL